MDAGFNKLPQFIVKGKKKKRRNVFENRRRERAEGERRAETEEGRGIIQ